LCERDTFQGERCLYNALNDRIRNLLLSYDYSKSSDPLQPLAAHITSLLSRDQPKTSDLTLITANESYSLHKFILAARSPYFAKKLATAPEITTWKLPNTIPSQALQSAVRFLYLSELAAVSADDDEEQEIFTGIEKLSRTLEIERLFENIIEISDRRLTRQRRTDEVKRGQNELVVWFRENVIRHKMEIDTSKAADVKWDKSNGIFADVLLQADEDYEEDEEEQGAKNTAVETARHLMLAPSIPIGPMVNKSRSPSRTRKSKKSVLFPAHKAVLVRSEFFNTMFCSSFREAQDTDYLQIIPIDCSPEVLEVVLTFLYTEKSDFPLDVAIDVLFAADLLFIDKLKVKAAQIISTLGNGSSIAELEISRGDTDIEDVLDIYDVIRAGWDTRVQRLEEFGARYIAQRLERYIDEEDFLELVQESAGRVKARQETDTIELIDE
jgi:ankyrin repeat/BTB/POZ domain-containing protein 1